MKFSFPGKDVAKNDKEYCRHLRDWGIKSKVMRMGEVTVSRGLAVMLRKHLGLINDTKGFIKGDFRKGWLKKVRGL